MLQDEEITNKCKQQLLPLCSLLVESFADELPGFVSVYSAGRIGFTFNA